MNRIALDMRKVAIGLRTGHGSLEDLSPDILESWAGEILKLEAQIMPFCEAFESSIKELDPCKGLLPKSGFLFEDIVKNRASDYLSFNDWKATSKNKGEGK